VAALEIRDPSNASMGYYSPADLTQFYELMELDVKNVDKVDMMPAGVPNIATNPDVETQLDTQWITAMAMGARTSVWHVLPGQGDSIDNVIQTVLTAAAKGNAPYVL
jgi:subtilase family serine protease